jgi:hypothetical protein
MSLKWYLFEIYIEPYNRSNIVSHLSFEKIKIGNLSYDFIIQWLYQHIHNTQCVGLVRHVYSRTVFFSELGLCKPPTHTVCPVQSRHHHHLVSRWPTYTKNKVSGGATCLLTDCCFSELGQYKPASQRVGPVQSRHQHHLVSLWPTYTTHNVSSVWCGMSTHVLLFQWARNI